MVVNPFSVHGSLHTQSFYQIRARDAANQRDGPITPSVPDKYSLDLIPKATDMRYIFPVNMGRVFSAHHQANGVIETGGKMAKKTPSKKNIVAKPKGEMKKLARP